MDEDVITLEDALTRLADIDKSDIYVSMKSLGGGKYQIPIVVIPFTVGSKSEGTLREGPKFGKVLLAAAPVSIAATTVAYSPWFNTQGCKYLLVTIVNPTWVTNPTGVALTQQFTPDNGVTIFDVYVGTSKLSIALNVADAIQQCFFLYQVSAANEIMVGHYPSIGSEYKVRLVFTPVGTADAQIMTVNVYGAGE